MTTAEVANKLVAYCREGKFDAAMHELYGADIVSVEAFDMNGQSRTSRGIEATAAKGKWWQENHEVHAMSVTAPFLAEDKFAVVFDLDVTFKPTNTRKKMVEVAVYTVRGGKVVHEEFLYGG
jgi:hypothetical protein